jgi:ArsR family transcriptional regulator, lead/cadmium/zinc/bismuth-responsive transcriptional repressor
MELDQKKIKKDKKKLAKLSQEIEERTSYYALGSDPTRLKILLLLDGHDELCVSELAETIGTSLSAVSHQLRLLVDSGLVKSCRKGKTKCYCLTQQSYDLVKSRV